MTDPKIFTPAQVGRAGEDVALQIEAAIVSGQLQPGESLPSEREMQALFKTGRGVIREAIRALRQKGLIEIRKGAKGGAFVKQLEMANVSESLALFLKQNDVDPHYVIEFRESVDRAMTELAIVRGSDEEKQALYDGACDFERTLFVPEPDMAALSEIDRELNTRLARMTDNPIFEWITRAMQLGFSSHDVKLYDDPEYRKKAGTNWRNTAREIMENQPMRALGYVSHHYVMLRECLDQQEKEAKQAAEAPSARFTKEVHHDETDV